MYLCALPRKQVNLVAYKLQEIFGVIGYPKIMHSDNGKEFKAKVVHELLRKFNPNILSVFGQPWHPQDQGSVENMSKFAKRNIGAILSECKMIGKNPTWTEVWKCCCCNQLTAWRPCKDDVSLFEAVYGQVLHHKLSCSNTEARRCWANPQRLKVTNNPDFDLPPR